jgi:hypothetical protein
MPGRELAATSLKQAVLESLATARSGWRLWVFGSLLVLANVSVYFGMRPLIEIQHERPDLYRSIMAQAPFPSLAAETRRTLGYVVVTVAFLALIVLVPVAGWYSRRLIAWLRAKVTP